MARDFQRTPARTAGSEAFRSSLDRRRTHWYGRAPLAVESEQRAETPDSDASLVHAMARGDSEALAALYDRHSPLMLGLARRIVGTAAEAEDIVHDVFVEAWRRAADYDENRGSVKAWLVLRTRSRAIDFRKSANVTRTVVIGDGAWLANLVELDGDPSLAPDRSQLRRSLLEMSAEQREVLLLGYFEGLSSSDMAARLGIPIGTVKSRVAAALATLRLQLADPRGNS